MEKNFGTRVRQARHKAGLTQAALAEKLNLDETTISRIENGSQATSFATMLNFSEALDVKFDYLICDLTTWMIQFIQRIRSMPRSWI